MILVEFSLGQLGLVRFLELFSRVQIKWLLIIKFWGVVRVVKVDIMSFQIEKFLLGVYFNE